MNNADFSAFEKYEFFGEFFPDDKKYEARFSAKIYYSLNAGLKLHYNIIGDNVASSCERLYGYIDNGKKCTLIGPFNFLLGNIRCGAVGSLNGVCGFSHLIIGEFVKRDDKFECCRFSFSHMQEFFHSQDRLSGLKYIDDVIESIKGDGWTIEIENVASYEMIGKNITNLIFSEDKSVVECIDKVVNEKKLNINLRKSLKFVFKFTRDCYQDIENFTLDAYRVSSLFAIFMNKPVFPDEVDVFLSADCNKPIHVISSILLESRTADLAKKEQNHFFMPINRYKIDLTLVLKNWLLKYNDFKVFSTVYQYETGLRSLHAAYSDIVLFLTGIESIHDDIKEIKKIKENKNKEKYVKPIDFYGEEKLIKKLKDIFSNYGCLDMGVGLGNLRGEIAHFGRPKVLMNKMNIDDYVDIGRCLKLIVASHLLREIGVEMDIIHEYQRKLLPE